MSVSVSASALRAPNSLKAQRMSQSSKHLATAATVSRARYTALGLLVVATAAQQQQQQQQQQRRRRQQQ
jgi:hypothetical protein